MSGAGNSFRLRHAYARWNEWLTGQTWSTLVDVDASIETLDFGGADGAVNIRRTQLAFAKQFNESLLWKLSIEDNTTSVSSGSAGETRNRLPIFASGVRLGDENTHVYWFNGISETRFVPDVGAELTGTVWVTGLSGRLALWKRDSWVARIILGDGVDALVNVEPTVVAPVTSLLSRRGFFLDTGFQHHWNERLRSNIAYRIAGIENDPTQPADAFRRNQYFATNLILRPIKNVDCGVEYLFGERINRDRQSASANRLQFSVIWRLP